MIASCAQPPPKDVRKKQPIYGDEITNPELKTILNEYLSLSARNNIYFTNKVSIGFTDIKRKSVIGVCGMTDSWREIDLDSKFWKKASWPSKIALVYHELTHCYCTRGHDFDNGVAYPDNDLAKLIEEIMVRQPISPLRPSGYLDDNCPKSIMHPYALEDGCFTKHYSYYVKEMFARCKPW